MSVGKGDTTQRRKGAEARKTAPRGSAPPRLCVMSGRIRVGLGFWLMLTISCGYPLPTLPPPTNATNANVASNSNERVVEEAPTKSAKPDIAGDSAAPAVGSHLASGLHTLVFTRPGAEQPVNYLLFLPENYAAGARWPLIFSLHGKSLAGDDPQLLTKYGPPQLAGRDPAFSFVLVAPQARAGTRWTDVETLAALLADVLARYPVDQDRVYLTGFSMGAGGAWRFGGARPERFAAVVAVAGTKDLGTAKGLARTHVWAIHGTDDQDVPASDSQEMVDAISAAGGEAKLELLPGRDHDIVDVFDRKDLYTWLLEHRRLR